MLRGFYAAASGMISQQRQIEMNTNNMANANTPGYKTDQSSLRAFPEMLLTHIEGANNNAKAMVSSGIVGGLNTGVYVQDIAPLMKQGDLRDTGNQTDVAIWNEMMPTDPVTNEESTVLFQVQTPEGIAYTRNGNFAVDGQGFLTTSQGNYVLSNAGTPIQIQGNSFSISEDGVINESGIRVGQLGLAYSGKPSDLTKLGNGLFSSENPLPVAAGVPGVSFSLKQGNIESSNVDLQQTMTNMMNSYRLFEMNQKVLKAYDQSLEKTVTEIGRVR